MKITNKQHEKILLAHCVIEDERLKKDLTNFLKQINNSFIVLLEQIGIKINTFNENAIENKLTLPLNLSGNITHLIVRDANNKKIILSLGKSFIVLEETENDSVGTYLISSDEFNLEQISVLYSDGSSFSMYDSFITLKNRIKQSITIILNEDQDCSPVFKDIAPLCVDALNTEDFNIEEILNFLKNNQFIDYTIIRKSST